MNKTQKTTLFITITAFLALLFFKNYIRPADLLYNGTIEAVDIEFPVNVYFDEYGVPSIFAETDEDMFFVAGYVGARDRLFQMSFMKYAYKGQLSKVLNDTLFVEDKFLRTLGFETIAEKSLNKMPPEIIKNLQSTCDGINAYIQTLSPKDYPLEFKLIGIDKLPTFEPKDIAGLSTMMAWELQGGWDSELFFGALQEVLGEEYLSDIMPSYKKEYPTIANTGNVLMKSYKEYASKTKKLRKTLETDKTGYGSNAWVVSGEKTSTGKPLLANDPHLALNLPPWWYEIRLKGSSYNFGGYGLYGFPLPVLGHNENIAWGFTNVMTDDMDFYIETLNEDATKYFFNGKWEDVVVKKEKILLKSGKEREIVIRSTHRGPIVSSVHPHSKNKKAISFKWTEFDAFDETTALFKIAQAKNWTEFSAASKTFGAPGQNLTYADTEGNIGWRPGSKIPIRNGAETLLPFDGSTSKHDWKGYVPFEEMPFLLNPEKGYISNGNNKIVNDTYPYYISKYWADPSRAKQIENRIDAIINDKRKIEVVDMMDIQNDITSPFAKEINETILFLIKDEKTDKFQKTVDLLRGYNGVEATNSQATIAFHTLYLRVLENIFSDELETIDKEAMNTLLDLKSITSFAIRKALSKDGSIWIDNINTKNKETVQDILVLSLEETHKKIKGKTWGDEHTVTFKHRLDKDPLVKRLISFSVGPFPMAGSGWAPRAASYQQRNPFKVTSGASMRRIIDLSNFDNGFSVLPTGQSGLFDSPHYKDQTKLYNEDRYKPFRFSRGAIKKGSKNKLSFIPK